ncbi:MAG: AAA family ATPase [Saprospiraceae bacterium]|nr:AAA family ATPase [Saprospiraceae bacterium]
MAESNPTYSYLSYGARVSADSVQTLLEHALDSMATQAERPTPICIWGLHGIGKTELVRDLALARGCAFAYIAPAQFEEMGDLLGMPKISADPAKGEVTRFVAPEWVPRVPGPGILLLDDVNRADDRILRGLMQLFQNYELVSWSLPQQWLIVCTANPDGGDYSVTTLDEAMLTRMLHVTMEFDAQAWARWAERHGVDARGINFVLAYPELVNGRRTTPRSLVQFFNSLRPLDELRNHLGLVRLLGDAALDAETTQAFLSFVNLNLDRLPTPADILEAENFEAVARRLDRLVHEGDTKRLDVLSIVVTRLSNYLLTRTQDPTAAELANLQQFLLLDLLPNDLRLAMAQELTGSKRPGLMKLYAVPEIGQLLLRKM